MASTDGGAVASGNETVGFWDKFGGALGETFIKGANKWIDVELADDSKNMPDQNDLIHGYTTNKNSMGTGISPQMLIIGGVFLLLSVVVIKKVL